MEEWKEYKIGDICRIKHGFAFKGIHFVDEPQKYVCVTPGNFALKGGFKNDKPKYYNGPIPEDYVLQKDDLVVTMTDLSKNGDTLGYSALIPYDEHYTFLHNQRIGLIEDISNEIDKHFLYWVMRTYDYQRYIVGHCSGSTVKHTSPSGIGSYIFRSPNMKMQKEISSVLDNLDDKIEVNRKIIENLEQQAQALFKSWFVDFEPFKNGEFVESELEMIPKGWRVYSLSDFLPVITGKKDANVAKGGSYPFFSCSQDILWTDNYSFSGSAILVAGNGDFNVKMYNGQFEAYQRTYVLMPFNPSYTAWLYYAVKYNLNKITSAARGSVIKFITKGNLSDFKFAAPYELKNFEIIKAFDTIRMKISANVELSRRLAELRDTLLPKLMSGELKVNEIENYL